MSSQMVSGRSTNILKEKERQGLLNSFKWMVIETHILQFVIGLGDDSVGKNTRT